MAGWWQPAAGATRAALETPCLVLDLDILERNIAKMLAYCTDNGLHWRPHAKVYKSTALAKKVVAAGAIGVTCAKLSEAEAMGAAGVCCASSDVYSSPRSSSIIIATTNCTQRLPAPAAFLPKILPPFRFCLRRWSVSINFHF